LWCENDAGVQELAAKQVFALTDITLIMISLRRWGAIGSGEQETVAESEYAGEQRARNYLAGVVVADGIRERYLLRMEGFMGNRLWRVEVGKKEGI